MKYKVERLGEDILMITYPEHGNTSGWAITFYGLQREVKDEE